MALRPTSGDERGGVRQVVKLDWPRLPVFGPALPLVVLGALQLTVWTLAPALSQLSPPPDVIESALWGREGVIVSYKHPNLPGLLIEAAHRLTGQYGWPNDLLSQIFVVATYGFVFWLGLDLLGPAPAAAGALLLAGCVYFSWPSVAFNHNVAQMPFWAAFCLVLWRAAERDSLTHWLSVGVVAALGMYAKLSTSVLLFAGGVWLVVDRKARARLHGYKPWLGLALLLVALAPLLVQMSGLDYLPLRFAVDKAKNSDMPTALFLLGQFAEISVVFLIAALALYRQRPKASETAPGARPIAAAGRALVFLLLLGLLPFAILVGVALALGAVATWSAPMFNLVGLLIVMAAGDRVDEVALRRISRAAFILVLGAPLVYAGVLFALQPRIERHTHGHELWPQQAISARMTKVWADATGAPLKIVGGTHWIAGLVALTAPDRPSIYTDLEPRFSPWITPDRLKKEGALVVWEDLGAGTPVGYASLIEGGSLGVESFDWPRSPGAAPLRLGYAIIPPDKR